MNEKILKLVIEHLDDNVTHIDVVGTLFDKVEAVVADYNLEDYEVGKIVLKDDQGRNFVTYEVGGAAGVSSYMFAKCKAAIDEEVFNTKAENLLDALDIKPYHLTDDALAVFKLRLASYLE